MKIVLHIGLYKTGTTAIQGFCSRNRVGLAERGMLYPAAYTKFNAHHPVPWALGVRHPDRATDMPAPEQVVDAVIEEARVANAETVVLSSEEFINLETEGALQQIKSLFSACPIRIVLYLRRQDYLLQSSYGQHVRMYSIRFPGTIFDFFLKHRNFVRKYNYWSLLQRWANVFGPANVSVKVYERANFPGGSVVADFLEFVGIDSNGLDLGSHANINSNLSPLGLEVLRRLNSKSLDEATHHRLIQVLEKSGLERLGKYELLSYRNRVELMSHFAESNAMVARHWFGREDGVLFEVPASNVSANESAYEKPGEEMVVTALLESLVRSVE